MWRDSESQISVKLKCQKSTRRTLSTNIRNTQIKNPRRVNWCVRLHASFRLSHKAIQYVTVREPETNVILRATPVL